MQQQMQQQTQQQTQQSQVQTKVVREGGLKKEAGWVGACLTTHKITKSTQGFSTIVYLCWLEVN